MAKLFQLVKTLKLTKMNVLYDFPALLDRDPQIKTQKVIYLLLVLPLLFFQPIFHLFLLVLCEIRT